MIRRVLLLIVFLWIALTSSAARAEDPIPPPPTRWVTDTVGFLSPPVAASLDQQLAAYERRTGHQVIVWIGGTIGGFPLDEWATKTFEAWRLGRKGIDDGLALFILADDRKIAIEVGYGLEDKVPDARASQVIRELLEPRLKSGQQADRDQAIPSAVNALIQMIEGRPLGPGAGQEAQGQRGPPPSRPLSLPELILMGIGALALIVLFIRHPALALSILYTLVIGRGRRDGGGGGDGGFGGGGGRSGGGGARGGW